MSALLWSERLLALATFLQSIELLQIRSSWSEAGVWRWSSLRKDFRSEWVRSFLGIFLGFSGFTVLIWVRLACSLGVWFFGPYPVFLAALFFSTWLIAIRWRGTFNGGSDAMTALVALSLWIAQSFSEVPWIVRGCLGYIAVQATASYFIAGWIKLRSPHWRSGRALPVFFETPGYDSPPEWIRALCARRSLACLAGFSVIAFECCFPLAWIGPRICLGFLGVALAFHLLNFWAFGLNRFFFAWMAAYPAIYFWSLRGISF